MDEKIIFAFAVTHQNNFGKKHFGDADKYLIYEATQNEMKFVEEKLNLTKNIDETVKPEHGSQKKGNATQTTTRLSMRKTNMMGRHGL